MLKKMIRKLVTQFCTMVKRGIWWVVDGEKLKRISQRKTNRSTYQKFQVWFEYTKNCLDWTNFFFVIFTDIYDCIKYDLQHNQHTLQYDQAEELYIYAKYLAYIVIPQEYGLTIQEKLTMQDSE